MISLSSSKELEVKSTAKPNWLELPTDVTADILFRLDTYEIMKNVRNVCSLWWKICKNPIMWQTIYMGNFDRVCLPQHQVFVHVVKICLYAVLLSSGHLKDIYIFKFATDDLLRYIVERASNLRCIQLDHCYKISDQILIELGMKLPLLEELNISTTICYGYCLPMKLKTFHKLPSEITDKCNADSFAIAKSMPGLRRLNISGHPMNDVGLLAILDGCPRLESLNLSGCFNLKFSENLEKRCCEQIKELLFPDASELYDICWFYEYCEYCGMSSEDEDSSYHSCDSEF